MPEKRNKLCFKIKQTLPMNDLLRQKRWMENKGGKITLYIENSNNMLKILLLHTLDIGNNENNAIVT